MNIFYEPCLCNSSKNYKRYAVKYAHNVYLFFYSISMSKIF